MKSRAPASSRNAWTGLWLMAMAPRTPEEKLSRRLNTVPAALPMSKKTPASRHRLKKEVSTRLDTISAEVVQDPTLQRSARGVAPGQARRRPVAQQRHEQLVPGLGRHRVCRGERFRVQADGERERAPLECRVRLRLHRRGWPPDARGDTHDRVQHVQPLRVAHPHVAIPRGMHPAHAAALVEDLGHPLGLEVAVDAVPRSLGSNSGNAHAGVGVNDTNGI